MAKYDKFTSLKNPERPVQVESAIRDGSGKNIENNYAKQDGSYALMDVGKAEVADNLTPYSDESGAFQDNPMISQGTGTNNNTAIVTTGNFAQLREKQGNTVPITILGSQNGSYSTYDSNGKGTFTYDNTSGESPVFPLVFSFSNMVSGHKYFINPVKTLSGSPLVYCNNSNQDNIKNGGVFVGTGNGNSGIYCRIGAGDSVSFEFYPRVHDITSWPSDVIADLTAHPDHFSWYYNGSLAYDAGSLKNSNGVKLVCTKRQLFNKATATLDKRINPNGQIANVDGYAYSDYILVIPNKPVFFGNIVSATTFTQIFEYDKNKTLLGSRRFDIDDVSATSGYTTMSPNCQYVRFNFKKVNLNIVDVSLYYTEQEGGEGYGQHYDYVEPKVYDTGSEVLRSAGSAHDVKLPDGTITRNVGVVDLGSLSWTRRGGSGYYPTVACFQSTDIKDEVKALSSSNVIANAICSKYSITSWTILAASSTEGVFSIAADGYLNVRDNSYADAAAFKAAMSGKYLCYELASPTTEQGTPFPENVDIDDYGMMYWLDENDELVSIPQGAKFFYPVNYKGFTDDLYNRTEGDAGAVVVEDEIYTKAELDTRYALKEALGGTLRQLLAVKESLEFGDTAYLDLGDLTWTYEPTYPRFYATIPSAVGPTGYDVTPKILCTKYERHAPAGTDDKQIFLAYSSEGVATTVYIKDFAYTNANDLKVSLKGVLLAYEKASS